MKFDSSFFLRLGLAFVFLYVAVSAFLNPGSWIGYIPGFLGNDITRGYFLILHDLAISVLGLWLLSGWETFWAGVFGALFLSAIIIANLGSFSVVFRDVGLFFAAVALALLSKENSQ